MAYDYTKELGKKVVVTSGPNKHRVGTVESLKTLHDRPAARIRFEDGSFEDCDRDDFLMTE